MKTKDIDKRGLDIIRTVFKHVLKSKDKNVWKVAIQFIQIKIKKIQTLRTEAIVSNGNVNDIIIDLWSWESARKQMINKFGKRFICKNSQQQSN